MSTEGSSEVGVAPTISAEAPASEAPESSESVDTSLSAESEAATPASTPPAFDWDNWDGETTSLPEEAQTWADPFKGYYSKWADKRIEERVGDVEGLKSLYETLLDGKADPRVDQFQGQVKEWENKYNTLSQEWEGKYNTLDEQYKVFQKNVEQAVEQEAEEYATWFESTYSEVFQNEQHAKVFAGLLEEDWGLEAAAQATKLPAAALQIARQAKADGVPDSYALRLAASRVKSPAAPRPGAKITSGATAPARSREQMMLPDTVQPTSFKDLRNQVARLALKRGN